VVQKEKMKMKSSSLLLAFASCILLTASDGHAQQAAPGGQIGSSMSADQRQQRDNAMRQILNKYLDRFNTQLNTDLKNVSTRDMTNAALYTLQNGGSPKTAEILIRKLFSLQNMDSNSPDFGYIPWTVDNPSVRDANSIEFDMQPMGAILIGYGSKLSNGFKKDIEPHLHAMLAAEANHHVPVSYTNIYLMNTMNTLALAQYLHDDAAYARGREQWENWRAYTAKNCIHEFDSPTYYGVDLGDLVLGFRTISDPQIHDQIKAALDYFWEDISANYVPSILRMVGPHARDYNFLRGYGGVNFFLFAEGVISDQAGLTDVFLEKAAVTENDRPGGYHPSPEILSMMETPERLIQKRWDEDTARYRYTWITQDFAIGSSDGVYSPQDKLFAADYISSKPLVTTSLVVDTFDQPYGHAQLLDRSGHSKPTHAPLNLSSVQEKGTALLLLDLDPARDTKDKPVATNLILPSTAEDMLLDGKPISLTSSTDLPAHIGSVVAVRQGHACLAAKIWFVDALQDRSPEVHVKADEFGLKSGAFRLVVYHGAVAEHADKADHLHVAALVRMEKCSTVEDLKNLSGRVQSAVVKAEPGSKDWTATATLDDLHLRVTEDMARRLPSQRTINGEEMATPVFDFNGKAISF
jgi:hypothetical protein